MTIILYVAGLILLAGGFLALGFGVPIKDFSLGSTVIQSGVIAIGAGAIVVGLASVLREMRRLREALEMRGDVRLNPRIPTIGAALPGAAHPVPAHDQSRQAAGHSPAAASLNDQNAAVPDAASADSSSDTPPWVQAHRTPRNPAAPVAGPGAQPAPHASTPVPTRMPGSANVPPPFSTAPPPAPPPVQPEPNDAPMLVEDDADDAPAPQAGREEGEGAPDAAPGKAAQASLASRFGFPQRRRDNPLPPLPRHPRERNRVAPDIDEPPQSPAAPPPPPDFDSIWPSADPHPAAPPARAPAPPAAPNPPVPVSILKSGTVEGMAYTLYSDGSIEADMASGKVRFASIEALRAHLDERGQS